jgi:cell division protease FtsH
MIDEEVKKLIDQLYDETRQILADNKDRVESLAKALMQFETLDGSDVDRIMRGEQLTKPTVGDLLNQENKRGTVIQPGATLTQPDIQPGGLGGGAMPAPG